MFEMRPGWGAKFRLGYLSLVSSIKSIAPWTGAGAPSTYPQSGVRGQLPGFDIRALCGPIFIEDIELRPELPPAHRAPHICRDARCNGNRRISVSLIHPPNHTRNARGG